MSWIQRVFGDFEVLEGSTRIEEIGEKAPVYASSNDNHQARANDAAGGTLRLEAGTHSLSAVDVPADTTIDARGATVQVPSGDRALNLASGVTIRGGTWDGQDDGSANSTNRFFHADSVDSIRIQGATFKNMSNMVLSATGCHHVRFIDNEIVDLRQDSGLGAVFVDNNDAGTRGSEDVIIRDNRFVNPDGAGGGVAAIILNTDAASGLTIRDVTIEDNYGEYMGRDGTGPRGMIDVYRNATNLDIEGNVSRSAVMPIVKGNDGHDVTIANNEVYDSGADGIRWQYRSGDLINRNLTIRDNTIDTTATVGIKVEGQSGTAANFADGVRVVDNDVFGATSYGVLVRFAHDVTVRGNYIPTPGDQGLRMLNDVFSDEVDWTVTENRIDMGGTAINGMHLTPRENTPGTIASNNTIRNTTGTGIHHGATVGLRAIGNVFENVATHVATGTRTIVNGIGEESANAETPTAADWEPGDVVDFTDSGDGSGTGVYQLALDNATWLGPY